MSFLGGGGSQSGMVNVSSERRSEAFSSASSNDDFYSGDFMVITGGKSLAWGTILAIGGVLAGLIWLKKKGKRK